jgi:heme/copper-type cytochrome/quinol oxidase subunit 2
MLSLLLNIIAPTVIMMRFAGEDKLGPVNALLVALAFPFVYGVYGMIRERKIGWMPIVGLVSILISGGVGLLKLPAEWIAVKEATIPLILAFAIIVSSWIGKPLARIFLDQILDKERVYTALRERGALEEYERRTSIATWLLASAFFLSAVLNFILATIVVTADGGTEEYTEQIGRMTALSFPVITIPVFIVLTGTILYIMSTVSKLTGLESEDVLRNPKKEVLKESSDEERVAQ